MATAVLTILALALIAVMGWSWIRRTVETALTEAATRWLEERGNHVNR